ncbi:hypothetical protein DV737_g240, partial [Chaetothyriales sp. CBS 132003]
MAKDKDRALNPAAAHRKAEKARALKKSRAQVQTQRNEKLARRNPERIQRQIDELKQLEAAGDIKQRERDILAELERDLKAVQRAKEALGQKAVLPDSSNSTRTNHVLGKRARNGDRPQQRRGQRADSGSDTDESVRRIPMPEDTPPPIPREHRRYFHNHNNKNNDAGNAQPGDRPDTRLQSPLKPVQQQTTYSASPQLRDLKKEAISKFVPSVVRKKLDAAKGRTVGEALLEPEEADRLEAQGYFGSRKEKENDGSSNRVDAVDDDDDNNNNSESQRLAEEEARFEREMAMVDANTFTSRR